MKKWLAFTLIGLLSAVKCWAGGTVGDAKIIQVAFQTGGLFLYSANWANPNGCTKSNAVVLLDTDVNYDKAYALLLAAYMAGKNIYGYSDKCVEFDGQTYNAIRGFKYLAVHD